MWERDSNVGERIDLVLGLCRGIKFEVRSILGEKIEYRTRELKDCMRFGGGRGEMDGSIDRSFLRWFWCTERMKNSSNSKKKHTRGSV